MASAFDWLFDNLATDPYGFLPWANLSAKTGGVSTAIKEYKPLASYTWVNVDNEHPDATMLVPGIPKELVNWTGGTRLEVDTGEIVFDENHLRMPSAPVDPIFYSMQFINNEIQKNTNATEIEAVNFQEYDLVTDAVNLQKLFAFARSGEQPESGGGIFRIDFERIGNTLIATRIEGADRIAIDYDTFDQNFKRQCVRPTPPAIVRFENLNESQKPHQILGSFNRIVTYTFGSMRFLVRYDSTDCADYATLYNKSPLPEDIVVDFSKRGRAGEDSQLNYISAFPQTAGPQATMALIQKLECLTTVSHPHGKDFPVFQFAHLLFSGIDTLLVGWWAGNADFKKPARYSLPDINKFMKPLPYATLSRVHDILVKLKNFMSKCHVNARISLVWNGGDSLAIFERSAQAPSGISPRIREFLLSQVSAELIEAMRQADAAAEADEENTINEENDENHHPAEGNS